MFSCFLGHPDAPLPGRGYKASPGATSTVLWNNRSEGLGICTLVDRGRGLLLEIVECEAEHLHTLADSWFCFLVRPALARTAQADVGGSWVIAHDAEIVAMMSR
jgi:hypothetical protein